MKFWMFCAGLALAVSHPSQAHLQNGSLKPSGGETYKPGDALTVEWVASQAHDGKYDIYLSRDGGKTWPTEFAEGWQGSKTDGAKSTYKWTIPANTANTTQARIRVCQLFGGHCTQPGTYTLMSGDFTISNATGIQAGEAAAAPALDFNPDTRNVEVSFGLADGAKVALSAFDATGREVAVLLDGTLEAGRHRLNLSSTRLRSTETLVFRLVMGSESRAWTWTPAP